MTRSTVPLAYAVWPTAWGPAGAVRNQRGLCRIVLPHYHADDLRALLRFEHPSACEDEGPFAELIELSRAYFNGQVVDFAGLDCDLPAEKTFSGCVLRACRRIGHGQTRSYSWLAAAAGKEGSARAAAAVMSRNSLPLVVPCHRVIYANGQLGGFSSPEGVQLKRRMLALEGAI